ncbi:esterase/lipase family protein [Pseudomarimonas salicorniae]|uniref:Alpha/beta hydrolase n=1 Tax=Pseudomarimonas salicorniae TaxID=2933270 RepID=A0ABT0GF48_9GAMM|nr:alpha/beta hydrolase [Lysobacter sp. CAU 1642]
MILIHGLWMRALIMRPLAARLRAEGFDPRCFDHASLRARPEDTLDRLAGLVAVLGPGLVHLVGHSLGGVLALTLAAARPDLPTGRIVCLGSPLAGSRSARRLRELGLSWLGGRSRALLEQGVSTPAGREVGMIAGTRALGAGQWLSRLERPHDGTVSVAETRVPGLADHLCLPHSHSGLLFAADVARATARWLRHGRFA